MNLMDKLIYKDSISEIDKVYVCSFSKKNLKDVKSLVDNKKLVNNKNETNIEEDIPTKEKLNLILNSNKRYLELKKKYFPSEEFYIIFKTSLEKNKTKEKQPKNKSIEKDIYINYSNQVYRRFKVMQQKRKKYEVSENFRKLQHEKSNRIPSVFKYIPNYNSIRKHVPSVTFNQPKYFKTRNNKKQIKVPPSKLSCSVIIKENKYPINLYRNITIKNLNFEKDEEIYITENKNKSNHNSVYYEREPNRAISPGKIKTLKNLIIKNDSLNDSVVLKLEPKKIEKNISVPNFNKMTGRNKSYYRNIKVAVDYSPNYDAIYSNLETKKKKNYNLQKKKYKLRKILVDYNPPSDYLLLPFLNK